MVKSITKIRPYRVFKKNALYYVKINKNGDKQIVKVIINNLLAQRKSRARKKKDKRCYRHSSSSTTAGEW